MNSKIHCARYCPKSKIRYQTPFSRQFLLFMKLVIFITLLLSVRAYGAAFAQQITLTMKRASLREVFTEIKKQSGYQILYNVESIEKAKLVDLNLKNVSLQQAMSDILENQPLTYSLEGKVILITPKKEKRISIAPTAKQQAVRGKVTDKNGDPLQGVSILAKGSNNGTTTNANGEFVITVQDLATILVIKYLGYTTREIGASTDTLQITLAEDLANLDEVVIVGYGTQKKSELIGSVAQLDAKQVNNRATPQLSQALTGQMPGVSVIQRSGQPGSSGGNIQIRGVGSFGAGTGALILVDGIPTNSFNDIDPNDVASISVLKDASSAAIYGARAATGVILVTTKTGANLDKLKINYHGYVGLQKTTTLPEFVNSWEYATALNETTSGGGGYTEEEIQQFKDGSDPDNYPNTDYIGTFFEPNSLQTAHNISISNNTEKAQYVLSTGYLNQDGILKKNNFQRYNIRLNLVSKITDKLKLTTRLSGIQTSDDQPAAPATLDFENMNTLISQVIRYSSIYPIKLSNGDWGLGNNQKGNPISFLESESFYKSRKTDLGANARLDWNVIDGLTLSAIGGYTQQASRNKLFRATQRLNEDIFLSPSSLNQSNPYENYKTFQALAEYTKSIQQHNIKFLAGYSFEKGYTEGFTAYRQGFPSNDLTELNVGSPEGQQNTGTAAEWALESLFGRLQYNFANKYLLEGVLRYDGSSRFPDDQKYALFPSIAVGWRIGQEDFFKEKWTWLTDLKIKGSYGVLGNQSTLITNSQDQNYYPYQNILNINKNYPFGDAISPGVARNIIVDPTLRWESTRTADIGLEASFLQDQLGFSATYYDRYTYDILVSPSASVSQVLGFDVGVQNSGKLKNKGWEFTLQHQKQHGDWGYNASLNVTIVKNEVLDLGVGNVTQPNGLVGNGSTLFNGYPMQLFYGYRTDGLFVDEQDVNSWVDMSAINPNPQPGDVRYRDISGPEGVPDGKVDATYDRTILGSEIPKYNYGLNLGFNYKGFDLSALLQGVSGVNGYLSGFSGYALYNTGNIQRWQYDGRWTPSNPDRNAEYPRMEQVPNTGTPNNAVTSDFWMLNAKYLRLKNVQIGYSLPSAWVKRWNMDGLRVYLNAENLVTWSSFRKGWDPETKTESSSGTNTGGGYYPILRNFTLGVNVSF